MSNRLRLSSETSENLNFLSRKLGLKRNIICRLGIGASLTESSSISKFNPKNSNGYEFNRVTIMGDNDLLFKALVDQHEKRKTSERDFFAMYVRNHIERGVSMLYSEYTKVNSPIEFLVGLFDRHKKKWYGELF